MSRPKRDPRLRILETNGFVCLGCEQTHYGLFHLTAFAPKAWTERFGDRHGFLEEEQSGLIEDFCMLAHERFFIRGILEIPVEGVPESAFAYGIWAEVPQALWEVYEKTFHDADQDKLGTDVGELANPISGFSDPLGTKLLIHFQANNRRPKFEMPIYFSEIGNAQQCGISFDRMLELYAEAGHNFQL